MRLSEILKQYRSEHNLSQRKFAELCGDVTNGYVSMVENEINPSTGKKVFPSIEKLSSFARGMGISLRELLEKADDIAVQDANDASSVGERLLNYMSVFGDSSADIAALLAMSVEDLNRVIACDLDLSPAQAEILAKRYGVESALFYDDDDVEEAKPALSSGLEVDELIRLFEALTPDEQQQILGLVRVMSKAHIAVQPLDG